MLRDMNGDMLVKRKMQLFEVEQCSVCGVDDAMEMCKCSKTTSYLLYIIPWLPFTFYFLLFYILILCLFSLLSGALRWRVGRFLFASFLLFA